MVLCFCSVYFFFFLNLENVVFKNIFVISSFPKQGCNILLTLTHVNGIYLHIYERAFVYEPLICLFRLLSMWDFVYLRFCLYLCCPCSVWGFVHVGRFSSMRALACVCICASIFFLNSARDTLLNTTEKKITNYP